MGSKSLSYNHENEFWNHENQKHSFPKRLHHCYHFQHSRRITLTLFFCIAIFSSFMLIDCAKCYYDTLGIKKGASTAEIKKAYRKLSIKYHPDRNSAPGAGDKLAEINTAYEVLNDKEKRQIYDEYGEAGLQQFEQNGGHHPGHSDIYDFFGFGGQRQQKRGKQKHESTTTKLYLTLDQLYFGELLQISFDRPVVCLRADECVTSKKECSGPGAATITQSFGPGFLIQNLVPDDSCVDAGKAWKSKCSACPRGATEIQKARTSIFVEPGMHDSESILFEGGGIQKIGFEPGDVVFRISQIPHKSFTRQGNNLHTTVFLTLLEALVGFEKTFPHVSRQPLKLSSTEVIHDGQTQIIKGQGMPVRDSEGSSKPSVQFGDLQVTYKILYPEKLTQEEKESARRTLTGITTWKFEAPTVES